MRIAVAGKGGAGKTSIAGTMARVLARDGWAVLAVDGDCGPNLALTLGVPAGRLDALPTLPPGLVRTTADGVELTQPLDAVRRACAVPTPDRVDLLVMARPERAGTGCLTPLHATVRAIVRAAPAGGRDVCILDTDATPEQFSRGVARHVDLMLIVAEATRASMQTAVRMAALARDLGLARVALVANQVRSAQEGERLAGLAHEHALPLAGTVPYDAGLREAERAARAPLDAAPDGPAVAAIAALARAVATARSAVR